MTSTHNPTEEMTGQEVFVKILWDTFYNAIFYGVAAAVITIVGLYFWRVGVILFGIFALVMVISTIQTVFVTVLGIAMIPFGLYEKLRGRYVDWGEQLWLGAANIVRIIDLAILSGYILWLIWFFFLRN